MSAVSNCGEIAADVNSEDEGVPVGPSANWVSQREEVLPDSVADPAGSR